MATPSTQPPAADRPSFLKGLFAGAIHDDLLFPFPPTLDRRDPDEARTVRRLIAAAHELRDAGLIDSARFDEEETVPDATIRAMAEVGLLGITVPREYGGAGLSSTGYARVFGTVAAMDASLGVVIGVHAGLGCKPLVLFGTDEQKARYLPALARGEMLAAYALTEPETGSDAQHIVTRAEPDGAGGWRITGRKHWIGLAHKAGLITVFAQTPTTGRDGKPTRRPTAFLVRPDMPGFEVVGTVRKMGIRGSTQAELAFRDCAVPADHVLGEVGRGFGVAVNVLNGGRLSLAAGCAQSAKLVVGEMARYAEQRIQFGAPLASFEITQRKLSTLAAEAYAADAMVGHLGAALDREDVDASLEAAAAKVFASELIWRACDEMVQVAGGRGYVKPYPYERMLRDARINRIFEGANDVLRVFVALNGVEGPAERLQELGAALKKPIANFNAVAGYATDRVRTALGAATDGVDVRLHRRLLPHKRFLEKHTAELKGATQAAIVTHRRKLIERQFVIERLANMAIELYARAATIARTQALLDERGEAACAHALSLCGLFCVESGRRFREQRELLAGRGDEVDDVRREVAAHVRAAAGYDADEAVLDARPTPDAPPPPAAPETSGAP
ncbi:acyl-CoA dehydrogenase family protein, partial [Roseisolibacter sp. H3M3-2]|uniref:acyl-CoA dehydrogenase family protein n=1 Tax=Roseisolibacter sp. H3M3-2 TaxID=3031323 RepID=UPI0023D9FD58